MKNKITFIIILIFFYCSNLIAQQQNQNNTLSRSFQGINLGIDKEEFERLAKEKNMTIQGELEIYFNQPDKNVVAVLFPPYFRKILFFFFQNKLSMIIFIFEPKYISLYEEYQRLYKKYGNPVVNQKQFIWEDDQTILILEKDPFLVKLIDKLFFKIIEEENQKMENLIQQSLDSSLDTL
ncbi:MAG: hypothetical protein ACK4YF_08920 [Exilispira sp.]